MLAGQSWTGGWSGCGGTGCVSVGLSGAVQVRVASEGSSGGTVVSERDCSRVDPASSCPTSTVMRPSASGGQTPHFTCGAGLGNLLLFRTRTARPVRLYDQFDPQLRVVGMVIRGRGESERTAQRCPRCAPRDTSLRPQTPPLLPHHPRLFLGRRFCSQYLLWSMAHFSVPVARPWHELGRIPGTTWPIFASLRAA
jgi:hypothetical protein